MEEIKIIYSGDTEFTKEELKILASLDKEILRKITDKVIKRLTIDLLNKEISPDFIKGYERAIGSFLSNFNNKIK